MLRQFAQDETAFFLGVGFYKPHTPFVAPKHCIDLYSIEDIIIPYTPEGYMGTLPVPAQELLTRWRVQNKLSEELALSAFQACYALITFLDAQVGQVSDALDECVARIYLSDGPLSVHPLGRGWRRYDRIP